MKKLFLIGLFCAISLTSVFAQDYAAEKARADKAETKLKDWANIARYNDADAQVKPPAKGEERVVFFGDSITDWWKLADFFPAKPYINRGIAGQTTPQMLIRFRPDVLNLKPKVVVILAGTNDLSGGTGPTTLEAIQGNLTSMAELARAYGVSVVFASILPVSDYHKNKKGDQIFNTTRRPPAQILQMNEWMKKYAAQNNLVYLDYHSAMVDDKGLLKVDLSYDGLHPDAKGYAVMKPLAEKAVAEALKKKVKK